MTATTTETPPKVITDGDLRSNGNPPDPKLEVAPARTRARASVPVTQRVNKWADGAGDAVTNWWAYTARPATLRETWEASRVEESRVPASYPWLATVWWWANATERLALFAIMLVGPTFLQGPLRWIIQRPTRRVGLYVIVVFLAAASAISRAG